MVNVSFNRSPSRSSDEDSIWSETDRLLASKRSIDNLRKEDQSLIQLEEDFDLIRASNTNPFIEPSVAAYWKKVYNKCNYECKSHFDPTFEWTKAEEDEVLKVLGYRVTLLACFMFVGLQIDRGNIGQAISDNMLEDLGLTTEDYNLSNTLSKLAFLAVEIPSGMMCKWLGPDTWLPIQIVLWSLVAISQGFITGRTSFLVTRTLIAILEGGFIPEMVLWLSYFFTSKELSVKLSYFWSSAAATQCFCGLLAFLLLRMRGFLGLEGWRWLFIIEGIFTLIIGVSSYFMIVPSVVETKTLWNPKGWFDHHQEKIVVNRVLRDDPSKGDMHNKQAIGFKLLWKAIKDYDLWPVYIIGFLAFIPVNTITYYFTLNLKEAGFSTFDVNLLTIPSNILHIFFLIGITRFSEHINERSLVELISPLWVLPGLAILRWSNIIDDNKYLMFTVSTFILAQPYIHSINVSWVSRNSNSIKTRTISAALYNMFNQAGGMMAANVYRPDDAPRYRRGNEQLFWLSVFTGVFLVGVKVYYVWRNHQKEKIWSQWDYAQKEDYIHNTKDEGNKRLDFRFVH
jgi:hypothetical protein